MDITLYMATTPNGMVARLDDRTDWSSEEWALFLQTARHHGVLIVGRRTYEIMQDGGEMSGLDDIMMIVVSGKGTSALRAQDHVAADPEQAVAACKIRGFSNPLVAGGSALNGSFLQRNLVDRIILDVEPTLFSPGMPLCGSAVFEEALKLESVIRYGKSGVQLRYEVIRGVAAE